MAINDPKGAIMTNTTDDPGEDTGEEFNPSGGIPSHPADPKFGDKDDDDAYDESDENG